MIKIMIVLTVLVGLLTAHPVPLQAEPLVTVSGVISDDGQLFGSDGVIYELSLIHISEPTRQVLVSRMPSSA